jgi:hypothetical protein
VAPGQSSLQVRHILNALNAFYRLIKTKIQITYAKNELDGTIVYFKVPSEHTDKLQYDVVVWFRETNRIGLETQIKVYSNSPGFAYNFAYTLYKAQGLLFEEEFPKEFITMPPKTRNPLGTKAFDKHVYAAMKLIGSKKSTLASLSNQYDRSIEPTVMSFKDKEKEIKKLNDLKK